MVIRNLTAFSCLQLMIGLGASPQQDINQSTQIILLIFKFMQLNTYIDHLSFNATILFLISISFSRFILILYIFRRKMKFVICLDQSWMISWKMTIIHCPPVIQCFPLQLHQHCHHHRHHSTHQMRIFRLSQLTI